MRPSFENGNVKRCNSPFILQVYISINIVLGENYSEFIIFMADVNQDVVVNVMDIILLVNIILSE